jgi:hypothetical protein
MYSYEQMQEIAKRIANGEPLWPEPKIEQIVLQKEMLDAMNKNDGQMTPEVLAEIKRQLGRE